MYPIVNYRPATSGASCRSPTLHCK
jgi:hypothetical protein